MLAPVTRWFVKNRLDRVTVAKLFGKWLLLSVPLMLASGIWYQRTLPEKAQSLVVWGSGMSDLTFAIINVTGLLLIFVLGIMFLDGRANFPIGLTLFTALFSLLLLAEFEIIRENIRKPYVIYNYMYANGVLKSDLERYNKEGMLRESRLSGIQKVTETNKLQAGEELFRMQCISCHSIDGARRNRAMAVRVNGWSEDAIASFIPNMHQVRSAMPPFAGNEEEVKALAAYIHSVVNEKQVQAGSNAASQK